MGDLIDEYYGDVITTHEQLWLDDKSSEKVTEDIALRDYEPDNISGVAVEIYEREEEEE